MSNNSCELKPLHWAAQFCLLFGSTLAIMIGSGISPAMPALSRHFVGPGVAPWMVEVLLTLPSLVLALTAPLAGHLIDKRGRKPVLVGSLLSFSIFGAMGFWIADLHLLLASRALLGASAAGLMTAIVTLIGDSYQDPKALNRFMSVQGSTMAFGGVIFLTLSGFLADLGWNWPFLAYALALIPLPLAMLYLKEPKIHKEQSFEPLPLKSLIGNYLVAFLSMALFFITIVKGPFRLEEVGASSASQIGMILSVMTLISASVALLYSRIRHYLSVYGLFFVMFTLMGSGYLLVSMKDELWLVGAGYVLVGIGMAYYMPNLTSWIMELVKPRIRGRAVGIQMSVTYLGQFAAPFLFHRRLTGELDTSFLIAALLLFFLSIPFLGLMLKGKFST